MSQMTRLIFRFVSDISVFNLSQNHSQVNKTGGTSKFAEKEKPGISGFFFRIKIDLYLVCYQFKELRAEAERALESILPAMPHSGMAMSFALATSMTLAAMLVGPLLYFSATMLQREVLPAESGLPLALAAVKYSRFFLYREALL